MSDRLTVPKFGTDSTSQIPNHAAQLAGARFTYRYLSHFTPKVLTQSEFDRTRFQGGIQVCAVFEDEADAALKGYAYGKDHALFSTQQLKAATGFAEPIIFAVDIDPGEHAEDAFDPYFDGVAAVMGRESCGPYGAYKVVAHLMDRGFKRGWQTYGWSHDQFDLRAQVIQYSNDHTIGGVGCDFDHAYYEDFNQVGFKPVPVDPNHYLRFDAVAREDLMPKPWLTAPNEREVVKLYDKYRAQQRKLLHPHRKELDILRKQCAWFFGRLKEEARKPNNGGWMAFHRGWRGQQLYHRYLGQRVVKHNG